MFLEWKIKLVYLFTILNSVVKYKTHARKNVFVSITNNAGHKCRLSLHKFSPILLSEFLVRIVLIYIIASSVVISGSFFSCTIFCSTFSLALLFSYCSDFLFQNHTVNVVTYTTKVLFSSSHLKNVGLYFQTKDIREH
jgi:hypothetical protein